uniref:DUF4704 domain-containing protein n=1 Tax=Ditylenchus dipsaci TaxID=166011 RepID=A0A915DRY6_9BILA
MFVPSVQKSNTYFVQVPHAIMKEGVEVITTHSIHNSLHSVGGIQMLLPLFAQIDMAQEDGIVDYEICSTLLSVISLLLFTSPSAQQQLFHSQGFLIIAHVLNSGAKDHLTMKVLESFIEISNLQSSPAAIPLLKQLADIQLKLYNFLATDFFNNPNFSSIIRRTPTIIGLMHTLKVFYWVVQPRQLTDPSTAKSTIGQQADVMLPSGCEEKDLNRDEEFQAIFNFISTVEEDDNLYDVLTQVMRQLCQHPALWCQHLTENKQ